jgi:hypothetical protein
MSVSHKTAAPCRAILLAVTAFCLSYASNAVDINCSHVDRTMFVPSIMVANVRNDFRFSSDFLPQNSLKPQSSIHSSIGDLDPKTTTRYFGKSFTKKDSLDITINTLPQADVFKELIPGRIPTMDEVNTVFAKYKALPELEDAFRYWPPTKSTKPKTKKYKIEPVYMQTVDPSATADDLAGKLPANSVPNTVFLAAKQGSSKTSQACTDAHKKLKKAEGIVNYSFEEYSQNKGTDIIPFSVASDDGKIFMVAAEEFVSTCLTTDFHRKEIESKIFSSVGTISDGSQRYCTALLVARGKVLTARHCFVSETSDLVASDTFISGHWFELSNSPNRHQICGISKPIVQKKTYPMNDDWILVSIASGSNELRPAESAVSSLSLGDYLILPMLNRFKDDMNKPLRLWNSSTDSCRVTALGESCFLHGCQSLPGASGAPIFVARQNSQDELTLSFVGIHVAALTDGSQAKNTLSSCAFPRTFEVGKTRNIGLTVFEKINF